LEIGEVEGVHERVSVGSARNDEQERIQQARTFDGYLEAVV
jgi:hypothetical protein